MTTDASPAQGRKRRRFIPHNNKRPYGCAGSSHPGTTLCYTVPGISTPVVVVVVVIVVVVVVVVAVVVVVIALLTLPIAKF